MIMLTGLVRQQVMGSSSEDDGQLVVKEEGEEVMDDDMDPWEDPPRRSAFSPYRVCLTRLGVHEEWGKKHKFSDLFYFDSLWFNTGLKNTLDSLKEGVNKLSAVILVKYSSSTHHEYK